MEDGIDLVKRYLGKDPDKDGILKLIAPLNFKTPDQKILWQGVYYMGPTQTATLNELVSEQKSGIVLIWSSYSGGVANDYNFNHTFIPKAFVEIQNGKGVFCDLIYANTSGGVRCCKYIYIHNGYIKGHTINDESPNRSQVLRYVIGV